MNYKLNILECKFEEKLKGGFYYGNYKLNILECKLIESQLEQYKITDYKLNILECKLSSKGSVKMSELITN